jgi:hypothetical protein
MCPPVTEHGSKPLLAYADDTLLCTQGAGQLPGGYFWQRTSENTPSTQLGVFSGTRAVTSRNPLIHKGTTNSTKSPRFGAEGLQHGLSLRTWRCVEEPFATVNFAEFFFYDVG